MPGTRLPSTPAEMRKVALRAFDEAAERHLRWGTVETPRDDEDAIISLGSALFWACALDEQRWSVPGYTAARAADPHGQVLPGVRHARNRMAHGAVVIASWTQGPFFPVVLGRRLFGDDYVWQSLAAVGVGDRPKSNLPAEYKAGLAGRKTVETLHHLRTWFLTAQTTFGV